MAQPLGEPAHLNMVKTVFVRYCIKFENQARYQTRRFYPCDSKPHKPSPFELGIRATKSLGLATSFDNKSLTTSRLSDPKKPDNLPLSKSSGELVYSCVIGISLLMIMFLVIDMNFDQVRRNAISDDF